jgi:nicotinamidase-related amidase
MKHSVNIRAIQSPASDNGREHQMPIIRLDPEITALVLIDLQRGVTAFPAQPHTTAEVIGNAARLADAFRNASAAVVLVHVGTSADGGDKLRATVDEPQPPRTLPADFAEIVPELGPRDGDIVVALTRIFPRIGRVCGTEDAIAGLGA